MEHGTFGNAVVHGGVTGGAVDAHFIEHFFDFRVGSNDVPDNHVGRYFHDFTLFQMYFTVVVRHAGIVRGNPVLMY